MNSFCFGEYQAMAFAERSTCKAYSIANTGFSIFTFQFSFFKLTASSESTLKLKGPAICNYAQNYYHTNHRLLPAYFTLKGIEKLAEFRNSLVPKE